MQSIEICRLNGIDYVSHHMMKVCFEQLLPASWGYSAYARNISSVTDATLFYAILIFNICL